MLKAKEAPEMFNHTPSSGQCKSRNSPDVVLRSTQLPPEIEKFQDIATSTADRSFKSLYSEYSALSKYINTVDQALYRQIELLKSSVLSEPSIEKKPLLNLGIPYVSLERKPPAISAVKIFNIINKSAYKPALLYGCNANSQMTHLHSFNAEEHSGQIVSFRINIYNLYKHQKSDIPEIDSFAAINVYDDGSSSSNCLYDLPSSWTLKILGSFLYEKIGGDKKGGYTNGCNQDKNLASLFSRIIVVMPDETIIWDSECEMSNPVTESDFSDSSDNSSETNSDESREKKVRKSIKGAAGSLACDGLEIKRIGSTEIVVTILFFVKFDIAFYQLSAPLAAVVGMTHATFPGLIKALWQYVVKHGLQSREDPILLHCDAKLKTLFRSDEAAFSLSGLPSLLKPHLSPPQPIAIKHKIKLTGDWVENESVYDLYIEQGFSKKSSRGTPDIDLSLWQPMDIQSSIARSQVKVDELDEKVSETMKKILERVANRNFYTQLTETPTEFIKSLLTASQSENKNTILDASFLKEYEIAPNYSEYFRRPWVPHAVSNYLRTRNKPFFDEIGHVLASMNLPDPRKRQRPSNDTKSHNLKPRLHGNVGRPRKHKQPNPSHNPGEQDWPDNE